MQKYIKRILMCEPSNFSVQYSINPWMIPGTANKKKAKEQWDILVEKLTRLKIKIETIKQKKNLPDMVFSADHAIIRKKKAILSNFRYKERQIEQPFYIKWFEKNNFEILKIANGNYFEGGGDSVFWKNIIFVGVNFRSDIKTCKLLSQELKIDVIPLELIRAEFYHLDTCFFPLNNRVAFYFPEAFSFDSRIKLQKTIPVLVPIKKQEADNFAANSVVTDHHVIMQKGNSNFKELVEDFGYKAVESDISEFMKAGGGVHCLIQVLEEEFA